MGGSPRILQDTTTCATPDTNWCLMSTTTLLTPFSTTRHSRSKIGRLVPILSLIPEFLSYLDPGYTESTRRAVRRALKSMTGYLKDRPPTTENLFQWLRHRLAVERVSTGTLGEDRKYANKFFKWCVANRRLSENPLDPIPKIAVKITRRAVITDEQFEALKRAAMGNDLGFYGMIVVAWYTGMRLSDICGLRWDSIDWPTQVLTFVPRKTQRSGRTVELKLSGEIWDVLYERHRLLSGGEGDNHVNGPFVFDEAKQLYDRQNGDIQRQFRQLCSRAGLPKTITFHCFRHTRTTRMLNSDNPVDPLTAADFLGLSSLDTLRGYNHASLARKEKAMNL